MPSEARARHGRVEWTTCSSFDHHHRSRAGADRAYVGQVTTYDFLHLSRQLKAALKPADLDETLAQITAAAVEVLPQVRYASITIKHADGRLETAAPTDKLIHDLDAAQYDLQEGPCYEAAVDDTYAAAPYLATDGRWPRYAPVAVSAGVQAQAGIRLFETPKSNGALNLYADRSGAFENFADLSELFSHQSALAIEYAREITQLQEAVVTRQLIGAAVGVVMRQYDLDEARAFAFLTRMSSTSNVKLRIVAERLVAEANETGSS